MKSKKALKALGVFLALMAALTVLSRAADTLTICRVKTEKAKAGALAHKVRGDGVVAASRETPVWATDGLRVEAVCVNVGTAVEKDAILARFDENDVQDRLSGAQRELQKLESENVKTAETALAASLLEKTRAVADAEKALDEAKRTKEKKAARQKLARAKEDLELIQKEQEEKMAQEGLTLRALALEIAAKRAQVGALTRLLEDDCALRAPVGGVVTALSLAAGKAAGSDAAARIADLSGGLRLTLSIDREQAKYVAAGDEALVTKPGEKDARAATVEDVSPVDAQGRATVVVALAQTDYVIGGSVETEITRKSDRFRACVPASALRGDSAGDYVLVLRQKKSVLGDVTVAERVGVTVLDRDGERAAIDGALENADEIIVEADKPVAAGDRVREAQA